MNDPWQTIEALVVVRTYPVPSSLSIESSCTAGITRSGEWVRLYPIPYRLLDPEQKFSKWQWVQCAHEAQRRILAQKVAASTKSPSELSRSL